MKLISIFFITACAWLYPTQKDEVTEKVSEIIFPNEKFDSYQIPSGVENEVYLVSNASQRYVAKIFKKKSMQEVLEIDDAVSYLESYGIRVPNVVALTQLENGTPVQISQYVQGRHIDDSELSAIASLMGKLHLIPPSPLFKRRYKTDEHYRALFEKCSSWGHTEELKAIYQDLDLAYLDDLPQGIIHGNFSYTNILREKNDGLVLLDFDHLSHSYLLTDVVRCQMFYGFDKNGEVDLFKIENFVRNYALIRRLSPTEVENFYTHMKLMMMDTALEMYYHIYIKKDLAEEKVMYKENETLMPELLFTKIKNLSKLKALDINSNIPIIFFGLSGVGKTTLIHRLFIEYPDRFYIPVYTCTRSPREDDDPNFFEYVSYGKFQQLKEEGAFALSMCEGDICYGYRKSNLFDHAKSPLLNCSIYGMEEGKKLGGILVLIEGDAVRGLESRNDQTITSSRMQRNKSLYERFLSHPSFLDNFDIRHLNEWECLEQSVNSLVDKIFRKIGEHNYTEEKAAA